MIDDVDARLAALGEKYLSKKKGVNNNGSEPNTVEPPVAGYPMTIEQMIADDIQPPEVFVKGLLYREELIILSGPSKLGKTMLCGNIGLSLASGRTWHGFEIPKPAKVLYSQQEVSYAWFRQRLFTMLEDLSNDEYDLAKQNFLQATTKGLLVDTESHLAIFDKWITDIRPDVVIMDPLFTYHAGNENSVQEMNRLIRVLQKLILKHKISIILVHHHGKPSGVEKTGSEMHRGSSVIGGAADGNIIFQRVSKRTYELAGDINQYGELSFEMRNVKAPDPMVLKRNDETFWFEKVEPETVAKVTPGDVIRYLIEHGPTMRKDLIEEMMELHEASEMTVRRAIMKAKDVQSRRTSSHGRPLELFLDTVSNPSDGDEKF